MLIDVFAALNGSTTFSCVRRTKGANAIVITCRAEFRHLMVLSSYVPVPPVRLWWPFLTLPGAFIYHVASNYDVYLNVSD